MGRGQQQQALCDAAAVERHQLIPHARARSHRATASPDRAAHARTLRRGASVTVFIAALIVAFLGTGAAFHFYWGFGGRLGSSVAVPHRIDGESRNGAPLFKPGAVATLAVAVALSLICVALVLYVSG